MNHIIIGIHGLSNKPDEQTLATFWEQSILEGLKKNAGIKCSAKQLNFHSVYWADVMYPQGPDQNYDAYKPCTSRPKRYKDGWTDILRQSVLWLAGEVLDRVRALLGGGAIAKKVIKSKLPDLHRYYTDQEIANELRGRLKQAITENKNKRIMVIAHSMGSVIAYDALRLLGQSDDECCIPVEHFVTIGSPLGLPYVVNKISKKSSLVRTPSVVRKWTNFADRRDRVALDTHLNDDYAPNYRGAQVRDDLVLNEWEVSPEKGLNIHHKSYGYLRAPELTDVVKIFI